MPFGKSGHHNGVFFLRHVTKKIAAFTVGGLGHPVDFFPGKKKITGGAQFGKDNDIGRDLFHQLLHAVKVFLLVAEFGRKLNNRQLQFFHRFHLSITFF